MTELWKGGPRYEGGGAFPITTDSVLLADFVRAKPGRAVELCSGAGLISLLLLTREPRLSLDCAELDPAASAAAERNFAENGLGESVRALCLDIRAHRAALPHAAYGLAVCNPPYFAEGSGRASESMAVARSEAGCTLAEVVAAAAWCLRTGGASASSTARSAWRSCSRSWSGRALSPSACALSSTAWKSRRAWSSSRAARARGRASKCCPALILTGPDGQDTAEVRRIYHREEN